MVIATGAAVAVVLTGGTAAVAGAVIGSTAGATGATVGTGAAVGTAVGVGAAGGAIAGAGATGTLTGAGFGAAAGGTAAAGVGGSGAGLGTVVATACTGGWGLLAIGTGVNSKGNQITYDCWKPVIHHMSSQPSTGMLLKDMVCHPHIANVTVTPGIYPELPNIVLENIWNEAFEIEFLLLQDNQRIVGHAKRVCV